MPGPRRTSATRKAKASSNRGAPRTQTPDLRRRELMDAGERILLRKGFASTTIDDVTRAAGVAKGTYYLYFKSKDDLAAALRDRFIEDCRKRIETLSARRPANDWRGRLDAWVEGGICHYLDHLELHDIIFIAGHEGHGSMAQSALVEALADLIRAGAAAGAWRAQSPELVSLFLFYALHGVVDHIVTSRTMDRRGVIRLSQKIVRDVMGVSPESAARRILKHSSAR